MIEGNLHSFSLTSSYRESRWYCFLFVSCQPIESNVLHEQSKSHGAYMFIPFVLLTGSVVSSCVVTIHYLVIKKKMLVMNIEHCTKNKDTGDGYEQSQVQVFFKLQFSHINRISGSFPKRINVITVMVLAKAFLKVEIVLENTDPVYQCKCRGYEQ